MMNVALDVSKNNCYAVAMDKEGNNMREDKFENSVMELAEFMRPFPEGTNIVLEASYSWEHLYDWLDENGYNVKLANPVKTKAIATAKIKTDRLDAITLANLLRANLIAETYVPPHDIRDLRTVIRHRASLVKTRAMMKNKIHALLARRGIKIDKADLFGKSGLELLGKAPLKEIHRFAIDNYLKHIEELTTTIKEIQGKLEGIVKADRQVELLVTVPGIGVYNAALLAAEIGDIGRFLTPEHLCSYGGLVPSTYQSGNVLYHGRITKKGSTWIRWALIQAAHVAVRQENQFKRFYEKLKKKKGGKKAIVAVARKMLVTVYHMLKRKEPFMLARERPRINHESSNSIR